MELINPGYPHGGVLIRETTNTIEIIGSTDKVFKTLSSVEINAFSRLRVTLNQLDVSTTSTVQMCLYEEVSYFILEACPLRCFSLHRGSNDVALGNSFYYRKTSINYIRLQQKGSTGSSLESHTSIISEIQFEMQPVPILDENGICNDPNALTIKSPQGTLCKCLDGFVASTNGTKQQGDTDVCVSCLDIPTCLSDRGQFLVSHEKETCVKVSITKKPSRNKGFDFSPGLVLHLIFQPLDIGLLTGSGLARDMGTVAAMLVRPQQNHLEKVDEFRQGFELKAGGTFAHSPATLSLHGHVWSTMHLMSTYTIDNFSRLQLSLTISMNAAFVGMCLSEELDDYIKFCVQFHSNRIADENDVRLPDAILINNLAIGKPTTQSSTYSQDGMLYGEAKNAADGRIVVSQEAYDSPDTVTFTDSESNPWWQVDLEGLFKICEVVVHMGANFFSDAVELSIILYDDNDSIVFRYYTADPIDFVNIPIPAGTMAARVRVAQLGENCILSLSEVVVIECIDGPTREIDLPLHVLYPAKTVNYITFIQSGDSSLTSESYISDLTLAYGSIPNEIQQSSTEADVPSTDTRLRE